MGKEQFFAYAGLSLVIAPGSTAKAIFFYLSVLTLSNFPCPREYTIWKELGLEPGPFAVKARSNFSNNWTVALGANGEILVKADWN